MIISIHTLQTKIFFISVISLFSSIFEENIFATQDFVEKAPLTLLYTGSDSKNSPMHAGSAYQNVGLYCTSKGLNNVVRGYFDYEEVQKELNLPEDEKVIISQTIGWE